MHYGLHSLRPDALLSAGLKSLQGYLYIVIVVAGETQLDEGMC